MTLWKQLRIVFLAITLGGVVFVLVKIFLTNNKPKTEQSQRESYTVALFQNHICIASRSQADYNTFPHC